MIDISLFEKFDISVDGRTAESVLSGSKKGTQVLIYLLLNYGREVSGDQLKEVLWSDESTNPENALKTLISRLRANLTAFSPELDKCIVTGRGTYRWNTALDCRVDTLRVSMVCEKLMKATECTPEVRSDVKLLLEDYSGDLCLAREDDAFSISQREYYRDMFAKTVLHAIELYKRAGDTDGIVALARTALDIDMFEERFHIELIDALLKSHHSGEALAQYRYMSSLHYNYMGMAPNESLQSLYAQLERVDESLGMDVDSIKRYLELGEDRKGAFVCDYSIFKDVYRLQMRNLQRMGAGMYLAVVMLSSTTQNHVESLALDKAMRRLLDIMTSCLRKGDTIARYSPSQFALLLPTVNDATGRMVMKRIRSIYYNGYADPELEFSYKLVPLGVSGTEGIV